VDRRRSRGALAIEVTARSLLALAAASVLFILGVYLILTGRPSRPDLAERLAPCTRSVADDAETWLRQQR